MHGTVPLHLRNWFTNLLYPFPRRKENVMADFAGYIVLSIGLVLTAIFLFCACVRKRERLVRRSPMLSSI